MVSKSVGRLRVPARASVFYLGTSAIVKGIGILTTPIFTRILNGYEYGAFSYYMAILGVGSIISSLLFSGSVMYGCLKKHSRDSVFLPALLIGTVMNAIISILSFSLLAERPILSALIFLQLTADTVIGVYCASRRYSYDYKKVCAISITSAVTAILISVVLIKGGNLGYEGRIFGLLFASVIIAVPIIGVFLFRGERRLSAPVSTYLIDATLPLIPHAVALAVNAEADKLVVGRLLGSTALAKYTVVHSLGAGLLFAVSAIGSALGPWVTRKIVSSNHDAVREPLRLGFILLGAGTVMLSALSPEIMRFLAPIEYSEAIYAIFPIALASLPSFASSVCNMALTSTENGNLASKASVAAAGANLVFGIVLVKLLGYIGAGIALLLACTILFLTEWRHLRAVGLGETIPIKNLTAIFLITLGAVGAVSLLYDFLWARLLICIPAILCGMGALLESRKYVFEGR